MQGVVYAGRPDLHADNYLTEVAVETDKRTLREAVDGADVFLGLSVSRLGPPAVVPSCISGIIQRVSVASCAVVQ